jgi:hypothetical protein
MVHNPCTGTIRPLYRILRGLLERANFLDALSGEIMDKFQVECTRVLRNLNDHMGNMLCLAIFSRISSAWKPAKDSHHEDVAPTWFQNILQFFGPKRAQKTLDLVFLSVVMACSDNNIAWPTEDAVDCVQLALEICSSVELQQKETWAHNNSARIAKLCKKVLRTDIDLKLQIMVRISISLSEAHLTVPGNNIFGYVAPYIVAPGRGKACFSAQVAGTRLRCPAGSARSFR